MVLGVAVLELIVVAHNVCCIEVNQKIEGVGPLIKSGLEEIFLNFIF